MFTPQKSVGKQFCYLTARVLFFDLNCIECIIEALLKTKPVNITLHGENTIMENLSTNICALCY